MEMTESLKKIIEMAQNLPGKERQKLVSAIRFKKPKKGKKSITDFLGIWDGGKALYSKLDRESIYEK
jgi:hypothetical protein